MRITVVGAGALGSHVIPLLRNEPADIQVVDFDRVETKNTKSQFHGTAAVGKLKVQSLDQALNFLWKQRVKAIPHRLTTDSVEVLLSGSGLVVDCLDNAASRRIVQEFVRDHRIPCLHGALAAGGEFGRVVWDRHFVIDSEDQAGVPTCEDGEFLPFISIVSSYMARSIQVFLRQGLEIGWSVSPGGAFVI